MQSKHTYQSALGWFDLGNYVEAFNELDNLPPKDRASVEGDGVALSHLQETGEIFRGALAGLMDLENVGSLANSYQLPDPK